MINKKLKSKYTFKGSLDNAAITQLVECLAVNQDVTGSSPVGGVYSLAKIKPMIGQQF